MIMTRHDRPWLKQEGESPSSRGSYLRDLLRLDDARRAILVYVVAMALVLIGGLYALWRIDLLSSYLAANRAYVLERDARWEEHIKGQADVTREILRRLPER